MSLFDAQKKGEEGAGGEDTITENLLIHSAPDTP